MPPQFQMPGFGTQMMQQYGEQIEKLHGEINNMDDENLSDII